MSEILSEKSLVVGATAADGVERSTPPSVQQVDTGPPASGGLSSSDAKSRLAALGANAVVNVVPHPLVRALHKLWGPLPWMLEAAIVLQFALGEFLQGAVVALLLVTNALLAMFQEARAQATLDALKQGLALLASVKRDGRWATLPASELVPGDLVKLSLGAVVAADVKLLDGSVLLDQSMLTGESIPVEVGAGAQAWAGALVRRGEAVAEVTQTGERTRFGRSAELIRAAKVDSSQQKAILRVVRNLILFNGTATVLLTCYALLLHLRTPELISLVLVAILSAIPVALPSMFTLSAAIGARALAARGVLPTRLSAVDEAGGIDVLCADKTGTLTRNALEVTRVCALSGHSEAQVLAWAALASADGGQDPVDAAIRGASMRTPAPDMPALLKFVPFDPACKRSEATVRAADGSTRQVFKGAYQVISALASADAAAGPMLAELQALGLRVLAVASSVAGGTGQLALIGLIALSDPPRDDSAALVAQLAELGVRTVMVTGDARGTAVVVARDVGIVGPVWATSPIPADLDAQSFAIFAEVLPEDKFRLVQALQKAGHDVGMCGDGANDAPALRQAQMGIAVSSATDVAKSAAGIVLTRPGLEGVVASIREGRIAFQRILTYTLRSITHKVVQVLFLGVGLLITGHAILTPTLMVLMMVTGDFLAMSSSTDNVRPSRKPSVWRIGSLTIAGVVLGLLDLIFCTICLVVGKFVWDVDAATLQTLAVVTLVFSGQAVFYVARERQHMWSSRPGRWLLLSSAVDVCIVVVLAHFGLLMAPLAWTIIASLLVGAVVLAFALDAAKIALFRRLAIA